jgi:hypothetical protein
MKTYSCSHRVEFDKSFELIDLPPIPKGSSEEYLKRIPALLRQGEWEPLEPESAPMLKTSTNLTKKGITTLPKPNIALFVFSANLQNSPWKEQYDGACALMHVFGKQQ